MNINRQKNTKIGITFCWICCMLLIGRNAWGNTAVSTGYAGKYVKGTAAINNLWSWMNRIKDPVVPAAAPNVIQQAGSLDSFFEALMLSDSSVINILHTGDSHLQAGFFPGAVADNLQQKFGNAGRGYVFPYNLAKTNGPSDYFWTSNIAFSSDRIVDRNLSQDVGPGGIMLKTNHQQFTLSYIPKGELANGSIAGLELFLDVGEQDNEPSITSNGLDAVVSPLLFEGAGSGLRRAGLVYNENVNRVDLHFKFGSAGSVKFFGANIINGHNGILYSTVGINGAQFLHYNNNKNTWIEQLLLLEPQLIILSLGTNEAYGFTNEEAVRVELEKAVQTIKTYAPRASILFTTPPSEVRMKRYVSVKRKYKGKVRYVRQVRYITNPYTVKVQSTIVNFCKENDYAFWDFYSIMKGNPKIKAGWSKDHIHFVASGYQEEGRLLAEALEQAYENFKLQNANNNL